MKTPFLLFFTAVLAWFAVAVVVLATFERRPPAPQPPPAPITAELANS